MAVERKELDPRYMWHLEDIYPTNQAWEADLERLKGYFPQVQAYEGRLGESGEALLAYLRLNDEVSVLADDLVEYIMCRCDEDTRVAKYQDMDARLMSVLNELSTVGSFASNELLAIPEEALEHWYKTVEGLELYRRCLTVIRRKKEHILSPAEERLLAAAGELQDGPNKVYSMLNDADLTFPDVQDGQGNTLPLTKGTYSKYIESSDRTLRKNAFFAEYGAYSQLQNTFAAALGAQMKQLWFFAKARNYPSALNAAVESSDVPETVYRNLVKTVHENLPKLHRFVELRKKVLGVDELHYYDMAVPLTKDVKMEVPYEQAKELTVRAVAPMGEDYVAVTREGLENGWVDVYENAGKRSGAYSACVNVHPFVLLNYQDKLDDAFTLVHEMGHSLHTWLSKHNQPIVYQNYEMFVAEVASTCNEALLMHYLLERTTDRTQRAYLINYYLEQFRGTFFRQCQLAEFEVQVSELAQSGQGVTAEACRGIYRRLMEDYFGPALTIDKEAEMDWARIPHFYMNFYVYQYATGFAAAVALSQRILTGGQQAVEDYLGFLKGGCSKDPLSLLKGAGVDLSTPEPLEAALAVFDGLIDELEGLLD